MRASKKVVRDLQHCAVLATQETIDQTEALSPMIKLCNSVNRTRLEAGLLNAAIFNQLLDTRKMQVRALVEELNTTVSGPLSVFHERTLRRDRAVLKFFLEWPTVAVDLC